MAKRLQVLVDEEEYLAIRTSAKKQGVSVAEWVRQAIGKARRGEAEAKIRKLKAIDKASKLQHPTADIEIMLEEIEKGRRQGWSF